MSLDRPVEHGVFGRPARELVYAVAFAAGAGYGDPIEREPEKVARDVELGYVSRPAATELFRVVFRGDSLEIDGEATDRLRRQAIVERLGREPTPPRLDGQQVLMHVTECLDLVLRDGIRLQTS